ncbi:MAG: FAD-dependent thymidylate synthase [Firmicutes bacterium]|nr:FAD-dependent thymidylate synthase [Bacillota bacterium]
MKVSLLSWTPNPEQQVAAAARLCYSDAGIEALREQMRAGKAEKLVNKLLSMGHMSPLEHVSFTFGIEGVSRALSHQLVRHRIASYSQKSQRYVAEAGFEYVVPPGIQANSEAASRYQKVMREIDRAYSELAALVDKEDARYVLPNACHTSLVVTMNCRSLHNFFEQRCCQRAQWEIRRLAWKMLSLVREQAPILFANAGARCDIDGTCNEGAMSCGRWQRMQKNE